MTDKLLRLADEARAVRVWFLSAYVRAEDEILWRQTVARAKEAVPGADAPAVVDGLWQAIDEGFDLSRLPPAVQRQLADMRGGDMSEVEARVKEGLQGRW